MSLTIFAKRSILDVWRGSEWLSFMPLRQKEALKHLMENLTWDKFFTLESISSKNKKLSPAGSKSSLVSVD